MTILRASGLSLLEASCLEPTCRAYSPFFIPKCRPPPPCSPRHSSCSCSLKPSKVSSRSSLPYTQHPCFTYARSPILVSERHVWSVRLARHTRLACGAISLGRAVVEPPFVWRSVALEQHVNANSTCNRDSLKTCLQYVPVIYQGRCTQALISRCFARLLVSTWPGEQPSSQFSHLASRQAFDMALLCPKIAS